MTQRVGRQAVRDAIVALIDARAPKTICPSEAARRAAGDGGDWRALMHAVRTEAEALEADGALIATQKGMPVALREAKGAVRLARPPAAAPARRPRSD